MYAISSRRSTASGLDNISPLMLKNLPPNALEVLLRILNNFLTTQCLLSSCFSFRVIPIPKANSTISFRPIALSSALCKIFDHMLKSRLDWWLESGAILSDNLFAFRKGRVTHSNVFQFSLVIFITPSTIKKFWWLLLSIFGVRSILFIFLRLSLIFPL